MIKTFCNNCKKIIHVNKSRFDLFKNHFCSRGCFRIFKRKHAKRRKINTAGYVLIFKPDHHEAISNYILEHRYIIEQHIGRKLRKNEVVHHKGTKYSIGSIENKQDNRIKNLELLDKIKHDAFHSTGRDKGGNKITCFVCGKIVKRNPSQAIRTHRQVCSRECQLKLPRIKKYKDKKQKIINCECAICKKEFTRFYRPYKKCKKYFCSIKCRHSKKRRNNLGQFI